MKFALILAGIATLAAFSCGATETPGETKPAPGREPCWKDVSRKMLTLERQIAELEVLLSLEPAEPKPVERPTETSVTRLERQIAELRQLLLLRDQPLTERPETVPAANAQMAKRMEMLEKVMLLLAARDAETSSSQRTIAELEKRIRDLESKDRSAGPGSAAKPASAEILANLKRENEALQRALSSSQKTDPAPRIHAPRKAETAPVKTPQPNVEASAGLPFSATLRLRRAPDFANRVNPHGPNLLGVFEYELIEGPRAPNIIRVAHGIRWNGRLTGATCRPVGATVTLDLVPLWWYPDVNQTPRLEAEDSDSVLYIPRLDCNKLVMGKALSRIRRSRKEPAS